MISVAPYSFASSAQFGRVPIAKTDNVSSDWKYGCLKYLTVLKSRKTFYQNLYYSVETKEFQRIIRDYFYQSYLTHIKKHVLQTYLKILFMYSALIVTEAHSLFLTGSTPAWLCRLNNSVILCLWLCQPLCRNSCLTLTIRFYHIIVHNFTIYFHIFYILCYSIA